MRKRTRHHANHAARGVGGDDGASSASSKRFRTGQFLAGLFIVGFIWFIAGFILYGMFGSGYLSTRGFVETPCRIVDSQVIRAGLERFEFTATFAYTYPAGAGEEREASSAKRPYVFSRLAGRLPILEKYAPGTTGHTCLVNPADPDEAILQVASPRRAENGLGILGAVLTGIAMLIFTIAGTTLAASAFPKVRAALTRKNSWKRDLAMAAFLALFASPFCAIGAAGLAAMMSDSTAEKSFVEVPAKVLYSGVASHTSSGSRGGTTYRPVVGYAYTFGGKDYECDEYSAGHAATSNYYAEQAKADACQPGTETTAFVDPADPARAVLARTEGVALAGAIMFPVVFGVAGLAMLLLAAASARNAIRAARRLDNPDIRPRRLRRTHYDAIFSGAFALLWNLIAWAIALNAYDSSAALVGKLALLGFLGVGVGCVVWFVRNLVKDIRAPKLAITAIRHGKSLQLAWSLPADADVAELELELRGLRIEGPVKNRDWTIVASVPCGKFRAPVPRSWQQSVTLPDGADEMRLEVVATLRLRRKTRNSKPLTLTYPL